MLMGFFLGHGYFLPLYFGNKFQESQGKICDETVIHIQLANYFRQKDICSEDSQPAVL